MKKSLTLLFLCPALFIQAQLLDDFSDGNFTQNPSWTGDQLHFEVNSSFQLHLKSQGTDVSVLATPTNAVGETEWNVWFKLSLNTSANNFARIYLLADRPELDQPLTGMLIQAGGTTDSISLMKQVGEELFPLIHFNEYSMDHSTNILRIKIIYNENSMWETWMDTTGGSDFRYQGSIAGQPLPQASWFGFLCRYTSSNATKFYFDDVYVGPVVRDTVPPRITGLRWGSADELDLEFSESLNPSSACNIHYYKTTRGGLHPVSVQMDPQSGNRILLKFPDPFPSPYTDTLWVCCLPDPAGNQMRDTLIPFARYEPRMHDILIHEIMSDPEPVASLPPLEYLELFNRSGFPVDLTGWTLSVGSTVKTFPFCTIPADGFLLVSKEPFPGSPCQTITLFSSSTSLANEGTRITLRNLNSHVIHTVSYSSDWYDNSWKEEGGWSLEMIDPANPCGCAGNWKPSLDPAGGSPGRMNSVAGLNPDEQPPLVIRSWFPDSLSWEIEFSESIDSLSTGDTTHWMVEPGSVNPVSLNPVDPDYTRLRLGFRGAFDPGIVFTLTGTAPVTDCTGNTMASPFVSESAFPQQVNRMDVVINEVLSDPVSGSSRFVELFNRSGKVLDLSDLSIISSGTPGSLYVSDAQPLTVSPILLFPYDFVALAADPEALATHYAIPDFRKLLRLPSFPSMPNEQGEVALLRSYDEELIDRMEYRTTMHYPLLATREGVSLERISPERASLDPGNWHSASQQAGFATPGYANSQLLPALDLSDRLSVNPPLFTPDNDGHEDMTIISFVLEEPGFQISVTIYDRTGRLIRALGSQVLAGTSGEFTWDGTTGDHRRAPVGLYIVYAEFLHPGGKVERWKKPVVVGCTF